MRVRDGNVTDDRDVLIFIMDDGGIGGDTLVSDDVETTSVFTCRLTWALSHESKNDAEPFDQIRGFTNYWATRSPTRKRRTAKLTIPNETLNKDFIYIAVMELKQGFSTSKSNEYIKQ